MDESVDLLGFRSLRYPKSTLSGSRPGKRRLRGIIYAVMLDQPQYEDPVQMMLDVVKIRIITVSALAWIVEKVAGELYFVARVFFLFIMLEKGNHPTEPLIIE